MRRKRKKINLNVDIAPVNLIDLLLVLLIFFITTTTFLQLKIIELDVPISSSKKSTKHDNIVVISADKNCNIFIDKTIIKNEELLSKLTLLKKNKKNSIFQVAADKESKHACFVEILDKLSLAGIKKISILTKN